MIVVSVMYPNDAGATFDMGYYLEKHFALVNKHIGHLLKGKTVVVQGMAGGAPGAPAPFKVMTTLQFASLQDVQAGLGQHGPTIMADIPNFTNLKPVIQISEVVGG